MKVLIDVIADIVGKGKNRCLNDCELQGSDTCGNCDYEDAVKIIKYIVEHFNLH